MQLRTLLAAAVITGALPVAARADAPNGWTAGGKSVLILTVGFTDMPAPAPPPDGWTNVMNAVNQFYLHQSYSHAWISSFAVVPVAMSVSSTNFRPYADWKTTPFLPAVRAQALLAGYNTSDFDLEIIHTRITNESPVGTSVHGGKGCWLNYTNGYPRFVSATAHELGHNFGLFHTRGFSSSSYVYPSKNQTLFANEYGGMFDLMGVSPTNPLADFCAYNKNFLGWLPDNQVAQPATSGTCRVHAFDQGTLAPGNAYALKLLHDAHNTYWFEFRQALTNNPWSMSGLIVYSGGEETLTSGGSPVQLDMTPGSRGYNDPDPSRTFAATMMDGPLPLGRTFADANVNLYVTPIRKGGTVPESLDVAVEYGPFPTNLPPVVSLLATNLAPTNNQSVTFTASATDPNNDTMAYYWEFDDTSAPMSAGIVPFGSGGPNADATLCTNASHAWPSSGVYQVRCTVTDLRGGKATASALVTVGGGGGITISGAVNDENGNPIAGAVITSIGSTNAVASSETSSNGQYRIVVRTNNTYKLLARWQGRAFTCNTPGGSATGTVTNVAASVTNVNFTRVTNTWIIGGAVYLNGIGRAYDPAIDGVLTVHDGNPAHDTNADSNGNWRMTVPEGRLAITVTAPTGYTVRCAFPNPYEVMDAYTLLTLFVDVPGKVVSQGFGFASATSDDTLGAVNVPVVLTPPAGYTNSTWGPSVWLGGLVDARSTAAYGIDYRLLGVEINFTNNTAVFTNNIELYIRPTGATNSRLVMLNLAGFNFGANVAGISNFTYAIIPPGADADADAIPDAWEWRFAQDLTNIAPAADADGDGMDNLGEYAADTDPGDTNSVLVVTGMEFPSGNHRVEWKGGTGSWQYIETRSDLVDPLAPWVTLQTNQPPTALASNLVTAVTTNTAQYFRIRAAR